MNNKIFVAIAAWRDPFVINTIESLRDTAYDIDRVVFGVVFQGYAEDSWMISEIQNLGVNVRISVVDANNASPFLGHIRGKMMLDLLQDESYYFQIDSHIKAAEHWDALLIAELKIATKNVGKAVLQSYAIPFTQWSQPFRVQGLSQRTSETRPWIDSVKQLFDKSNYIIDSNNLDYEMMPLAICGDYVTRNKNLQVLEFFYDAKGIFAHSEYFINVTIPDNVPMWIEQPTQMLRLFTAGYSLVSTTRCYTNNFDYFEADPQEGYPVDSYIRYSRDDDPRWKDVLYEENVNGYRFYQSIIRDKIIDVEFGMFSTKTLDQYLDFIGYDPITFEIIKQVSINEHSWIVDKAEIDSEAYA